MDATTLLKDVRLVPVVSFDTVDDAVAVAQLLVDAGFPAIEITLRTPVALDAITAVATRVSDILVGAGSVRHVAQVGAVHAAGAGFAVCPGFSLKLLDEARRTGIGFVPGAGSAAESVQLLEQGYRLQKFFPAEQLGGIETIKALSGPLPEVRYFPTGGIRAQQLPDYLACPAVACVGGSWFIGSELVRDKRWAALSSACREALDNITLA